MTVVAPLQTPPLYTASPTLTVAGQDRPTLVDRILTMTVEEDTDGLRRLELRLGNWGGGASGNDGGGSGGGIGLALSDRAVLDFGAEITVAIGAGDRAGGVFDGLITAIEERYPLGSPPEMVVLAEDRLQQLRMTRRSRVFADVSDADVISTIAQDHSLTPEVDAQGPTHTQLVQANQTDLAFLRDRVRAVDARVRVDGSTLHVVPREQSTEEVVTLRRGADLRSVTVLADLAHQRTAVHVCGWDIAAKEGIDARADSGAISGEVTDGRSGVDVLGEALGDRVESIVHEGPLTQEEATALAESALRERARRFLTGTVESEGDSRITVGATIGLEGLSPAVSGAYAVTEVSHRFDHAGGYRTVARIQRPWIGGAS